MNSYAFTASQFFPLVDQSLFFIFFAFNALGFLVCDIKLELFIRRVRYWLFLLINPILRPFHYKMRATHLFELDLWTWVGRI